MNDYIEGVCRLRDAMAGGGTFRYSLRGRAAERTKVVPTQNTMRLFIVFVRRLARCGGGRALFDSEKRNA